MSFDVQHAFAVAQQFDWRTEPEAWMAGFLHDAIEDGGVTVADLKQSGLPAEVVEAVSLVTRRRKESYEFYIGCLAIWPCGHLGRRVKVADLRANLARMDSEHESLRGRYEAALARLEEEGT